MIAFIGLFQLRMRSLKVILTAILCLILVLNGFLFGRGFRKTTVALRQSTSHPVLQRIHVASDLRPDRPLADLLRAEIVCSENCPVFQPNLRKFAALKEESTSFAQWSKQSQSAEMRNISLQMWHAKRMDVAAARVLGCAVVDGHEMFNDEDGHKDFNGMCSSRQQINILLPLISHQYRGRVINRKEHLNDPQNNEWYTVPFPQCIFVTLCLGINHSGTILSKSATADWHIRPLHSLNRTGCSFVSCRLQGIQKRSCFLSRLWRHTPGRGVRVPLSQHRRTPGNITGGCQRVLTFPQPC
jgi:hypothetical protein